MLKPLNNRVLIVLILIVLGAGGLFGQQIFTDLFAEAAANTSNMPGLTYEKLNLHGQTRTYYLYTPKSLEHSPPQQKQPVVIVIHGSAANGKKIISYSRMNETADKFGFLVVYPEMLGIVDWDVESGLNSKDIPFISELIDTLVKNKDVDANRVFATGYSSGGDLMHIFALSPAISSKIAAYAPVCSNILQSVANTHSSNRPASMLMISGTGDPFNPWNGGGRGAEKMLSVPQTFEFWKKHDHCQSADTTKNYPKIDPKDPTSAQLISNTDCRDNTEVLLLEIDNGGHTWPGTRKLGWATTKIMGETNMDVNANELMWSFFNAHIKK